MGSNYTPNRSDSGFVSGDTINAGSFNKYDNKRESNNKHSVEKDKIRKKKTIKRRVILGSVACVLGIIIGIVFGGLYYKNYLLNKPTYEDSAVYETFIDENGNVRNIAEFTHQTQHEIIEDESVHNFLLIGIDSRSSNYNSKGTGGLADVIMILSVDSDSGSIKMLSIARDNYAYVPGYTRPMKINAAMSLAGPEVLKLTVENMLRLQIDGYAYVNFAHMAYVIDAVGGVYCNVTPGELNAEGGLNWNLAEVNKLFGREPDYNKVTATGDVWLNGNQAVAYARIRKLDSDYKRSERQVEVMRGLLTQFMNLGVSGKAAALDNILEHVVTNIPKEKIQEYALDFLPSLKDAHIEYMQLPINGCINQGTYGGEWSIRPNWNAEIPYVQQFFYGETREFDPVEDIPNSPSLDRCPKDLKIEDLLR
ncbi:MAG: LCP family protein [Saccharofermentans sp.]|nr:LCP family protein [Saccharofermentans sp.]